MGCQATLRRLILYNPAFFGTDHWVTFASCVAFAIWAVYLGQRLWWFQRVAPAIRYAIPTGIIRGSTATPIAFILAPA